MKQIGNWVFGSFFRTIGRLLVFVLLGFIIANVVDLGSIIDSFSITDLFFTKIKADSLDTITYYNYYSDSSKTQSLPTNGNSYQYFTLIDTDNGVTERTIYFDKTMTRNNNYDYITIPFIMSGYVNSYEPFDYKYKNCSFVQYTSEGITYYIINNCNINMTATQDIPIDINFKFNVNLLSSGGNQTPCTIVNEKIMCELRSNVNYVGLVIQYAASDVNNDRFNIQHQISQYLKGDTQITNSIEQQTQQQQQQHNETMTYFNDSNTTQAESEASDFFDDFSVDLGGLTGIITAPLSTIQNLLNSTCTNLVLPLPFINENLTLPCLSSIYSEHFGLFYSLYQTIILGIIAYRCIMSIFFDIKGFTNPDDDRIEVMDL